jgi:hypothetical protein
MRTMSYMKILLFLWIALAAGQPLLASAIAPPVQEDLRSRNYKLSTLFKLSGLEDVLGNIESIVQASRNISEDALAPGQNEIARGVMHKGYPSAKFYRALRRPFIEDYKPQHVRSAIQWYRSTLGKKILRLEGAVNELTDQPAMESFGKKLLSSPPSEKRIRLIGRIERTAHITEAGKSLFLGYVELMHPFNKKFQGKQLGKKLRLLRKKIAKPMRNVVLRRLLFSYRNLKDKDLEAYAKFLNSQAGKWFSQTVLQGFKKGIKKASFKADIIQARLLKEINSGGPDYPLLMSMVSPGQRYLLISRRDPFKPLVNSKGLLVSSKGLVDFFKEQDRKNKARLFGGELKDIPPVALQVFAQIEARHPKLYKELKHFERLFNNRDDLKALKDDKYAQALRDYRNALERAFEIQIDASPLQVKYDSLRMTGIIIKKLEAVAMFEIDTAGYAVKKGDRIGPFFGYVEEIKRDQVIVIEEFRNYLGKIVTNQKIIQFSQSTPSEGNTSS